MYNLCVETGANIPSGTKLLSPPKVVLEGIIMLV